MSSPPAARAVLAPLRAMIGGLSIAAVWELERALTRRLRPAASPARERVAELGCLAELLRTDGSRSPADAFHLVGRDTYDKARSGAAPSSQRLVERYGSWRKACRAADGLLADGRSTGPGKPWLSRAGAGPTRVYSDEQLADAIRACAASVLRRPSSTDYYRWCRARRAYLGGVGSAQRVPSLPVITSRLGGWRGALAAAAITDADLARWSAQTGVVTGDRSERVRLPDVSGPDRSRGGDSDPVAVGSEEALALPLSEALALVHAHDASLDWLAGRSRERGPAVPAHARFDGSRFAALRRARKVPEAQVRRRLGLPLGPYRQLLSGSREPTLGQASALASILGVAVASLLTSKACATRCPPTGHEVPA